VAAIGDLVAQAPAVAAIVGQPVTSETATPLQPVI
jgi:hypothetical protein